MSRFWNALTEEGKTTVLVIVLLVEAFLLWG